MKAEFGGVSADGIGSPESDVTQSGGGPNAFVASHSIGNAGGVTLSKFSVEVINPPHGPHRPCGGRMPATVRPIAMPRIMSNRSETELRTRLGVIVSFKTLTIGGDVRKTLYKYCRARAIFFRLI